MNFDLNEKYAADRIRTQSTNVAGVQILTRIFNERCITHLPTLCGRQDSNLSPSTDGLSFESVCQHYCGASRILLMRTAGFEPAHALSNKLLKLARLTTSVRPRL